MGWQALPFACVVRGGIRRGPGGCACASAVPAPGGDGDVEAGIVGLAGWRGVGVAAARCRERSGAESRDSA